MKKYLIFIVGIMIGVVGTSYAAYKLKAEQVSFDKTNTGLNSDNVQDILDELTTDILSYGDAESSDILEGKTALVNGEKITGTMSSNNGNITIVKTFIYGADTNYDASFNSGNQIFGKGKFIICISHGRISSLSININNCSKKEQLRYNGNDYNGGQRIYFVESTDDTSYISISGSVVRGKSSSNTQYPSHAGFIVIKVGE